MAIDPPHSRLDLQPHLVALDIDHPGFRDPVYRHRRDQIARQALDHRIGERPPHVDYTDDEEQVWQFAWDHLRPLHERFVCSEVRELLRRVRFDRGPIPQLAELDRLVRVASNFSMQPVAGLVAARDFLGALAQRTFLSTQYVRHASAPAYTPEPDLIHEYVGHATTLLDARFAEMHAEFGRAAAAAANAGRLAELERVYWYTVEYGTVAERGQVKALGAGLLSSIGELEQMLDGPRLLDWDLDRMARTEYEPTKLQPQLFVAPSFDAMIEQTLVWLQAGAALSRK